jgi:hypothetical protein
MTARIPLDRALAASAPRLRPRRAPVRTALAWLLDAPPGGPTPGQRVRIAEALRFAPPH